MINFEKYRRPKENIWRELAITVLILFLMPKEWPPYQKTIDYCYFDYPSAEIRQKAYEIKDQFLTSFRSAYKDDKTYKLSINKLVPGTKTFCLATEDFFLKQQPDWAQKTPWLSCNYTIPNDFLYLTFYTEKEVVPVRVFHLRDFSWRIKPSSFVCGKVNKTSQIILHKKSEAATKGKIEIINYEELE